jgi:aryl-alcohol dehydrogenase-like predicted oxidoreductase
VVFSHRPDLNSSIEETCKAFSWCIDKGLAFYWGTSEWPVDRIISALEFCEKHNLHKPIVE